jgi:hypothetical protein
MTVRATIKAVITADTTAAAAGRAAIKQAPLVIPVTAPLITGKRAVVYVAVPEVKGTYEGREIILGPRTKDYYVVWGGVKEGDQVVVNGNFKIDSAMQILAKPSMINSIAHDQIEMQFPAAPPAMETPANTVTEKIEEGHYIRKGYPATLPQMGVETASPAPSQKPDRPLPQRPVPPAR